jgi:glycosyltransferase involved in cell wall biosynthesis
LPVYNGAAYLREAIHSILNQTFTDFEFLIINDGSTDHSADILASYHDTRIQIIHQKNIGLAATLNKGIALAKGQYIARQDQDDISLPSRLAKQFAYMEQHPDCALLGTHADIWVNDQPVDRHHHHPHQHAVLCFEMLFNKPFVHSSVMFKRDAVQQIGGYTTDPSRQPPEDFELWSRLSRKHQIANLPESLLIYREVQTSMSRTGHNPFLDKLVKICSENLSHVLSVPETTPAINDVAALTHSAFHKLSKKPNLTKMKKAVIDAGQTIAKQYHDPEIQAAIDTHINILRHQYLHYQLKRFHLWPVAKHTYRIYKSIRHNLQKIINTRPSP